MDIMNEENFKKAEQAFKGMMEQTKVPGLAYALFQNENVHAKGLGFSNAEEKKEVNEDTMFYIGSTSKSFCCFGVMKLVEEGKIKLDDCIDKYIPEIKWATKYIEPVTIHHLMSQTSGMGDLGIAFSDIQVILFPESLEVCSPFDLSMNEKYVEHVGSAGQYVTEPGTFRYCNSNFTLCQVIIERVTGMKFEEYIRKVLFEPIGLQRICYLPETRKAFDNVSRQYQTVKKPIVTEKKEEEEVEGEQGPPNIDISMLEKEYDFTRSAFAPGAICTTVKELAKYVNTLITPEKRKGIIKDSSVDEGLLKLHSSPCGISDEIGILGGGYCYGWFTLANFLGTGMTLYLHPGDLIIGCASLLFIKELNFGIACVANTDINEVLIPGCIMLIAELALKKSMMDFRNFQAVMHMKRLEGSYSSIVKAERCNIVEKGGELYIQMYDYDDMRKMGEKMKILHPIDRTGLGMKYFTKSAPAGFSVHAFEFLEDGNVRLEVGKWVMIKEKENKEM